MKILVLSWDRLGGHIAGSAIRALELARGLARAGHEVCLAAPAGSRIEVEPRLTLAELGGSRSITGLVDACEVVVVSGRSELMEAIDKPLVVDLYDPFVLSNLDLFGGEFDRSGGRALLSLRWLQHHLTYGDFFLCAGEAQRSFWLGMLTAAGRVNRANYEADPMLERLLGVVPFGIPDRTPRSDGVGRMKGVLPGIGRDDRVVLWSGGMWNWVDPLTLVRATALIREQRPDVHTVLLGRRHPNPEIGEMEMARRALDLAVELDLVDRGVCFVDWVPYEERESWLLEADVGVSLHRRGVESEFAFRTRLLDYVWCGRPMVVTEGDELADLVSSCDLGRVVAPDDPGAVAEALLSVVDEAGDAARETRFEDARRRFRWSSAIEPLEEFCRNPRRAPDRMRNAWIAPDVGRDEAPSKQQAMVAQEFGSEVRALSEPLGATYVAEQSFEALYDRLCQVEILLRHEPPLPASALVFELRSTSQGGGPVARVVVPASQLPHEGWQRFEFRPIENTRGRRFTFRVSIQHDLGVEVRRGCVALWRSPDDHAAVGEGDDLVFIARYLIAGVESEVPIGGEDFLFANDATLPLSEFTRRGDPSPVDGAWADVGPPTEDLAGVRASLLRLTARAEAAEMRMRALEGRLWWSDPKRWSLRALASRLRPLAMVPFSLAMAAGAALVALVVGVLVGLGGLVPVRRRPARKATELRGVRPDDGVSVVIPTWNGAPLLDMSLPPLIRALRRHGHPEDEIVVVDNASSDDTARKVEHYAKDFPRLRMVQLPRNEGFAGATNRGAKEAANPALIFLNNDMVVEPDFVQPLLDAFGQEEGAFGVSCQIDFLDPNRPRWETGKVHAEMRQGVVRLFHVDRFDDDQIYPVFFAGGGASAYDRERFLALGGFDESVFSPVYIEDVDLGYRAWKRGWPSVLAPRSRVHHKHRGTTLRLWNESVIQSFFLKNLAALVWKNFSSPRLLLSHLFGIVTLPERALRSHGGQAAVATLTGLVRQIPATLAARRRERREPRVFEDEAIFEISRFRHLYRAHFHAGEVRREARPQVLVLTPYSPAPAIHGGAVRMLNLIREMSSRCDVTLLSFTDTPAESSAGSLRTLREICRDVVLLPRERQGWGGRLLPTAAHGFVSERMQEMVEIWLERRAFDVVQVEYTHMASYLPPACPGMLRVLVEHDVSFVAAARERAAEPSGLRRLGLWVDGLRTLRHEIGAVEEADCVVTMSENDRQALGRYVDPTAISVVPNGVSCTEFPFSTDDEDPATILFVGFFRHEPNVEAVLHFAREILPRVRTRIPDARFRIVGAYPPAVVRRLADADAGIEVTGLVPEVAPEYRRATVFVAPILRGSGTRLKILEAMASGCAVVSTTVGAEGIEAGDAEIVLADEAGAFATAIGDLITDSQRRARQARAARAFVEANYDWPAIVRKLYAAYGWDARGESAHA